MDEWRATFGFVFFIQWHVAGMVEFAVFSVQFFYPAFDFNRDFMHGRRGAADFDPYFVD